MVDRTLFILACHLYRAPTGSCVSRCFSLPNRISSLDRFSAYVYLPFSRAEKERRERLLFEEAERLADQHVTVNKSYIFLYLRCI